MRIPAAGLASRGLSDSSANDRGSGDDTDERPIRPLATTDLIEDCLALIVSHCKPSLVSGKSLRQDDSSDHRSEIRVSRPTVRHLERPDAAWLGRTLGTGCHSEGRCPGVKSDTTSW